MLEFSGKTAVITGGASGIGLAVARALGAEGMRLVIADIENTALEAARAELEGDGYEVLGVRTDVSKLADVENLAAATIERFGAVHVVHNNAGVVLAGRIADYSIEDWEWVMGVDLWGVIHGVKVFLPLIKQAGEGHIINTASSAGLYSQAGIAPYNVAKFGVVALTETLARELEQGSRPIGASVLCPGAVSTKIVESDRNREGDAPATKTHLKFKEQAAGLVDGGGLPPSQVADLVVQSLKDRRFWILPHPKWIDVLRDRVDGMANGGTLNSGFGG
jgi:NAD(P)-dependent dehydrogenase (short-subunit alcohol dehydrogenase family)